MKRLVVLAVALLAVGGCTSPIEEDPSSTVTEGTSSIAGGTGDDCEATHDADFPDVVDVDLEAVDQREFEVAVTLCSAHDTPERYADAWRVMTPDGEVLGVRELLHHHANEQPFTRSLAEPIEVPDGVERLVVQGRDLANGWGGATMEVTVPST